MPHDYERTVRVRVEPYQLADQYRSDAEEEAALTFGWADAIEHGIYAIYEAYAGQASNKNLSNEAVFAIVNEEYPGRHEYKSVSISERVYGDAHALKSELEDEWDVPLTWSDVLLVGVFEVRAIEFDDDIAQILEAREKREPEPMGAPRQIPTADLRDDVERVMGETGHFPTLVEMNEHGEHDRRTYDRRFEAWDEATVLGERRVDGEVES